MTQPLHSDLPATLAAPAQRALAAAGYTRLAQLVAVSEAELLRLHGIGPTAIIQLRAALAAQGRAFAGGRVSRVEQLAARFAATNAAVIALARGCRSAQWQAPCADDGRPIGVVAHHVADTNAAFTTIMARLVAGETYTPTVTMAAVDQENAQHAQAQAAVTNAVVIAALRHAGDRVTRHIQQLTDDQLDHVAGVFGGRTLTVAQVIDVVVIGHTVEHLASLRASLDVR